MNLAIFIHHLVGVKCKCKANQFSSYIFHSTSYILPYLQVHSKNATDMWTQTSTMKPVCMMPVLLCQMMMSYVMTSLYMLKLVVTQDIHLTSGEKKISVVCIASFNYVTRNWDDNQFHYHMHNLSVHILQNFAWTGQK